ncbi:MAG: CarD family transcriptional regulator [Syntrophomonadaceae bacterium]
MFEVNDYIVYGLTGVCQITDIARDEISNNDTQYYVLRPISNDNLTIKVPVNNKNVTMRPIVTESGILSLIANMLATETTWLDDDRQRNFKFKAALKSGKNEELIQVIRALHVEREARALVGKKLSKTDEDIMNAAEKQLNEEFAVALNISPEEVMAFIFGHIPS